MTYRQVAAKKIGRSLRSGEVVHHVNGNRRDNRPENLQVMGASEHQRYHGEHMADGCRKIPAYRRMGMYCRVEGVMCMLGINKDRISEYVAMGELDKYIKKNAYYYEISQVKRIAEKERSKRYTMYLRLKAEFEGDQS